MPKLKVNGKEIDVGRAKGLALHACFGSYCAQVVELSRQGEKFRIEKIWCVVDCGYVVNPDIVRAQVEGGIVYGLSAALKQKLTFTAGATVELNFNKSGILRLNETPDIVVDLVGDKAANSPPTGIGEVSVPAVGPALANAYATLTGQRLRTMPLAIVLTQSSGGTVEPPPPPVG